VGLCAFEISWSVKGTKSWHQMIDCLISIGSLYYYIISSMLNSSALSVTLDKTGRSSCALWRGPRCSK
jgi:hypothetical protein